MEKFFKKLLTLATIELLVPGGCVSRNLRLYIVLIGATNRTGLFGLGEYALYVC